jgi:hypothetical protein
MALVGVISAETDQAVFPFGKANSIATAIVAQPQPAWQPESRKGKRVIASAPPLC